MLTYKFKIVSVLVTTVATRQVTPEVAETEEVNVASTEATSINEVSCSQDFKKIYFKSPWKSVFTYVII